MNEGIKSKYINSKPGIKRYVISDIHGCYQTLRKLIEKVVCPLKTDQLFFLGDYIDRGPASGSVIDYILNLTGQGYEVYTLRGNHEENLLDTYTRYDKESFTRIVLKMNKCPDLLDTSGSLKKRYLDFIKELPYYIEMDDCYLVHAGFDFRKPEPFTDYSAMIQLYIDNDSYDVSILGGKRMIHGHRATEIESILKTVTEQSQIISLDNGCVYSKNHKIYDYTKLGHLCCLELNNFELKMVANIDKIN